MKGLLRYVAPTVVTLSLIAGMTLTVAGGTASATTMRPNGITPYCSYTAAEPQLAYGSTGIAVQQAQCELDSVINGPTSITIDGIFGSQTQQWTRTFQKCARLAVDGIIGPQTWGAMDYWSNHAKYC